MRCHVIVQHGGRTDHIRTILEQITWHLRDSTNRILKNAATSFTNQRVFGFHRLQHTFDPFSFGLRAYLCQHTEQQIIEISTMNLHSARLLTSFSWDVQQLCPISFQSSLHGFSQIGGLQIACFSNDVHSFDADILFPAWKPLDVHVEIPQWSNKLSTALRHLAESCATPLLHIDHK